MNPRSIQVRLTLWYTALIVVMSVTFGAYTYSSFQNRLYEEMRGMLARRVEHLRGDVLPNISTFTPEALAQKIEEVYSPEENDRFIRVSKPDRTVLYISGMPHENVFDPTQIPLPHDYSQNISERIQGLRKAQHILLVGFETQIAGSDYVLEMGTSTTPVDIALHKLIITLLIGLPLMVIIAVTGGSVLVRRALQPVEAMRATAQQISLSKLRQRLPVAATGDAIELLSLTLNQMFERLDTAYQQASRFTADASHELRTPLSVMRSQLEISLRRLQMSTEVREVNSTILEETERLSNIVEGLLSLAHLDTGEVNLVREVFDFAALACSTLDQMQLLAEEKSIFVDVAAPQPVLVTGDPARLRQVIVNLLDNAIKYTMPGGTISIVVGASGQNAVLSVSDNGIGIPKDALPHIFERFYRADKVRSRSAQGSGLGLSIVRAICHAHGGTVEAHSQEGICTSMIIKLPLAAMSNY